MAYRLYYWPGIPGRGEFVRLALEDGGASYVDIGREQGINAVAQMIDRGEHFAPPVLADEYGESVSHVAQILAWISRPLGLAPQEDRDLRRMQQLQLTVTDFVVEIHDTHHPLGPSVYYEDQLDAATRRSRVFINDRLPLFLNYFEGVLRKNPYSDEWLIGQDCTTLDLSLFLVMRGLGYAFPNALAGCDTPALDGLHKRVAERPAICEYLNSDRCIAFNNDGVFRHYAELDGQTQ